MWDFEAKRADLSHPSKVLVEVAPSSQGFVPQSGTQPWAGNIHPLRGCRFALEGQNSVSPGSADARRGGGATLGPDRLEK